MNELGLGRSMLSKAIRILENATANHAAVDGGIFGSENLNFGEVLDIAVDDELSLRSDLIAQGDNLRDEFVMSGDFGHFFASAEVNSEGGEILP